MKKIIIYVSLFFISSLTIAQQNPSGTAGGGAFWRQGGNTGGPGSPNIFGTGAGNNNPIYTYTNGLPRTRLNGTFTTTVNGVLKPFDGYFGISPTGFFNTNTPFSMLHLSGPNDVPQFGAGAGWRQWMNTGVFMNENSDGMYVGLKDVGTNRSDAIINWSDDPSGNSGPDKLRFIHTGANTGNGNGQTDPRDPFALDGYEYMRMTAQGALNNLGHASGHIGIGPMFTDALFPQSRVHMNSEDNLTNYLQLTITGSTGQTANDGMRVGLLGGHNAVIRDGNGIIYNQEDRHLLFSTGNNSPNNINNSRERFRISHFGAPTNQETGGYGIDNPFGYGNSLTRTSISILPNTPIVRPNALFHLGFQNGTNAPFGWRNWMYQGTMVSSFNQNMVFVGLSPDNGNSLTAAQDAVFAWGKDASAGSDRLRFIFSSNTGASANNQGLEIARMWSDGNEGRTGFGDFYNLGIEPQNTVHINGTAPDDQTIGGVSGLRFEDLTSNTPTIANPGSGVLAVDANGDVIYVNASSTTNNILANNGATIANIAGQDYVQWGQVNTGIGTLNGGELIHDTEIPFNGFNVLFQDPLISNSGQNRMQVGPYFGATTYNLFAKFSAINGENSTNTFRVGGFFSTTAAFNVSSIPNLQQRPLYFGAIVPVSAGVLSIASDLNNTSSFKVGVEGGAYGGTSQGNIGVSGKAFGPNTNYGIYGTADGGTSNWAGYFNGDVNVNGDYYQNGVLIVSDQQFKTDINDISDANDVISQLQPRSFFLDTNNTQGMNFSNKKQYGLIAQEVENILPELVGENTIPALYDSLGNVVNPAFTYKTLNYNAFIGILLKAQQENLETIHEQDSSILALQDQINTLYGMITACCSNNSNMGNSSMQNQNSTQTLDITLNDAPSIVLDQNVPNPFAEQTTITYTLVDGVQKAQMLFYNIEGKLIQSVNLIPTGGKGQINVFANDLSTGIYTYTLVVDGEIKGTKRMVKE